MTYTKANTAKLQEIIRDGKASANYKRGLGNGPQRFVGLGSSEQVYNVGPHPSVVRLDHGGVMTYMFFWIVIELALTIGAVQLILKKGGL